GSGRHPGAGRLLDAGGSGLRADQRVDGDRVLRRGHGERAAHACAQRAARGGDRQRGEGRGRGSRAAQARRHDHPARRQALGRRHQDARRPRRSRGGRALRAHRHGQRGRQEAHHGGPRSLVYGQGIRITMAQTSVAQFASELKVPPSVLLEQLRAAGVEKKQADDSLSEADKSRLLEYLRRAHGSAEQKNKITLTRKQTSEIKKTDATGKYSTVQVEVRKKRVFVKRDPNEVTAAAVAAEAPAPVAPAPAPAPAPAAPAAPAPHSIDSKQREIR